MKKDQKAKVKLKLKKKIKYPGAETIQSACYEDYKRCIDTYDKIYDKINIALAFCGIILLVILSSFDYTIIFRIIDSPSKLELFALLLCLTCSLTSVICIVWSVIKLLLLMRSRNISVFDSIACRNEEVYKFLPDEAALWLIDKYTIATKDLKEINDRKNKEFNAVITKIVIALLTYSIVIVINKGV